MNKKHLFSLSLTLIIVMLFSAMGPTAVYADGETPPPPPTTETSDTDGETGEGEAGDTATEEEVAEEQAEETSEEPIADETAASEEGTDELPADETTEEVADEGAAEEPNLIEQVPENTEVVVLNSEGEVEPLATQEAAEAVLESDPIWCPGSQAPTPGENGCTDPYSSFDELLIFLKTDEVGAGDYQGTGTIYVEMGNYGGGESAIDFNTYGFTTFDDNDLTIQGGWNTSTGTTTDTTSFSVPIVIGSETNPWGGSLTLNNIIVSGVADGTALTVYSDGNVTIEDSEFTTNKDGVFIKAGKDVTVRNTKVNDNGTNNWEEVNGKGLEIKSLGYVTLEYVEGNDNQIFGADIDAVTGVSVENSFFSGNLMYTPDLDFYGYGLMVVSTQGDIALRYVEANENYLWGAWLDGPNVFIRDSKFNANLSDSDIFIDDMGLLVVSTGDVALRDVEANENGVLGANILADGEIAIRDSFFNRNSGVQVINGDDTYFGYGLEATSTTASISLSVVEVNDNYIFGANLDAAGDVTVTGSSFSRNAPPANQSDWGLNNKPVINNIELDLVPSGGLMIQSGGNVTLSTVSANNNQTFGADILANGFVDIENSVFSNNINGAGLTAKSNTDAIRLTDVITLGNGLDGANLETNCNSVTVTGGQYVGNAQYGIYVTNSLLALNGAPVFTPPDNGVGPTMVVNPGGCSFPSPLPINSNEAPLYTVTPQPESALPATLDQTFVSALQVTLTAQGQAATNLTITLAFPIPAGMEDANLTVMFWDGSEWIAAPGGSVIGNQFVITVTQPGIYVLVAQ